MQGLDLLFDQVDELEQWHDTTIRKLGLIANRIENNGEAAEYLELFEENFGSLWDVWQIRKRVVLQRATTQGRGSIFTHSEECDMAAEFREIAEKMGAPRRSILALLNQGDSKNGQRLNSQEIRRATGVSSGSIRHHLKRLRSR